MKFTETKLKGAYIIELSPMKDERGGFARVFSKDAFAQIGLNKEFVQFNQSWNTLKGTVRGMHFQKRPHAEAKFIKCIRGSAFDVMIDLRPDSSTYLQWVGEVISAENMKCIYIPEGFAHGFQTLEDNTELLYHHTEFYAPEFEGAINALDRTVGIKWPIAISLMSEKDKAIPLIHKQSILF
ncbi:MAG TPA: dTDP-4-dehydrorhamnose 3,5-epimerase [Bacteroidia bacterium]|nr:dTDP-4-dehydrorhamnose 3,5-epimerase [Bacteroidia bacterium]